MRYYYAALITALCALCVWGCFGLSKHLIVAIDRWGNAAPNLQPTVTKTNVMLDFISRPCASVDKNGHLLQDGPICELDQAIHDIRKITTASGKQVRQTSKLINATADSLHTTSLKVTEVADALTGTANAATDSLTAATDTLNEGKRTIAAARPLLKAYTQAGNSLNDLLRDRAIHQTVQNVASITDSGAVVMGNAAKVSTKLTNDFTAKKPWYRKLGPMAGDLFDYGALAARHTP